MLMETPKKLLASSLHSASVDMCQVVWQSEVTGVDQVGREQGRCDWRCPQSLQADSHSWRQSRKTVPGYIVFSLPFLSLTPFPTHLAQTHTHTPHIQHTQAITPTLLRSNLFQIAETY